MSLALFICGLFFSLIQMNKFYSPNTTLLFLLPNRLSASVALYSPLVIVIVPLTSIYPSL